MPTNLDLEAANQEVHIFAERYVAVAYLRTETKDSQIHLAFILACSRVAPKQVHSIPCLELCSALAVAHLASLLAK